MESTNTQDVKHGAELLLDVAQRLFMERGYANVSMQQIAEEAGMTKGAPYYHFQSKEDLFTRVSVKVLRELKERIGEACASEGTFEQRLNQVIVTVSSSMAGSLELWFMDFNRLHSPTQMLAAVEEALATNDLGQMLLPMFEEAAAKGEVTRVSPNVASSVFVSLLMVEVKSHAYRQRLDDGSDQYLEGAAARLVDVFLHGVS